MSGYDSLRSRTPKETLLEGFVKRMRKQNEEGRFRGSRIDHSNIVSNDSQEPSGEEIHGVNGDPLEKMVTKIQLAPVNPLNKLYCSLMSGLRNEIDFGLRVTTILANSKESTWISDFKFIDILIDCIESYSCCCDEDNSDLVKKLDNGRVYCSIQVKDGDNTKCRCLQKFWSGLREDSRVMNLMFGSSSCIDESGDSSMEFSIDDDFDAEALAHLLDAKKHEPKNHQRIYTLVKNVSEIIRNLSFNIAETPLPTVDEESGSSGFSYNFVTLNLLKFVALLISCKDQYYQNLGLDILSNVSYHIAINCVNSQYLKFLDLINRHCIQAILSSNDIHQTNRSLEIICKIVTRYSAEPNEYLATQLLDQELLQRLTELLTCQHDVSIVISSLELLYALSESYPKLLVEESKYLIKILVMLLNFEASQFFTKSALTRIKLVDERPKPVEIITKTPNQKSNAATTSVQPTLDNESYVIAWLRASFEAKPNTGTPFRLNEIYEEYVKECIRCERKNVISAHNFAILTKRLFPSITMTGPIIEGLARRPVTTLTKGPGGLSSPILKAQLCAPPKAGSMSPGPSGSNPPHTSNLIKNLLANKLRTNSGLGVSSTSLTPFSSITSGSVTVTPASASSPSSSNKDNGSGSRSDTTTTIIPCTINNLNSTFTQPQKSQESCEPYPDPSELQPSANKTAFSNSTPSHKSKDSNSHSNSSNASVITSNSSKSSHSSHLSSTTTVTLTSTSPPSSTSNSITVTSTTLPQSTSSSSLSTSVTITPAIPNTSPLIPPVSSGGSVNTQQVIVPANPMTSTSTASISQSQTTCITPGQALQGGSVFFTTPQPGQTLQPNQPQQILIVRTIVGNQQQAGLVGMPAGVPTGTPVRLILPPGFLTQQRPVLAQPNTSVNGVNQVAIANPHDPARSTIQTILTSSTKAQVANPSQTIITNQPISSNTTITTVSSTTSNTSSSNDILLKAVLGSGIVGDNNNLPPANQNTNVSPNRSSAVKSSPLLNVLLDKGKLPDFSSMAGTNNQTSPSSNSCVTTITSVASTLSSSYSTNPPTINTISPSGPQSNKVYILTTKSPLPMKSTPSVQQQPQQNQQLTGQLVSSTVTTNNLQKPLTVQQINPTLMVQPQNLIQQPVTPVQPTTNSSEMIILNSTTATSTSSTPTLNKLVASTESSTSLKNTLSPAKPIRVEPVEIKTATTNIITVKNQLSNGEIGLSSTSPTTITATATAQEGDKTSATKTPNDITIVNNDLSKTVEISATRLVSKRSNEEDEGKPQSSKKSKPNNSINSLSITPVKKEIKLESQLTPNKIKTNGTSVITSSSNAQQVREISSSSTHPNNKTVPMTDTSTNPSSQSVNGTPYINVATSTQPLTSKSKTTIKPTTVTPKNLQFHCEWHECRRVFSRPSQVYWHVHKEHVDIYGNTSEKMTCKWGGPEGRGPGCLSSRPKLSLLTHINDFHCNAAALQQSALRRESGVNLPPPIVPPAHPGYASNAALLAIRRHAINYVELPKPPPITPLTPITTSISLTAALILRNMAKVSPKLRSFLQSLEPYLSELCVVEGRDESRTIAQCLGVISDSGERRRTP